jgi:hypothetical protein
MSQRSTQTKKGASVEHLHAAEQLTGYDSVTDAFKSYSFAWVSDKSFLKSCEK